MPDLDRILSADADLAVAEAIRRGDLKIALDAALRASAILKEIDNG